MTNNEWLRARLEGRAGLRGPGWRGMPPLEVLRRTEWSEAFAAAVRRQGWWLPAAFERVARDRMVMGAFRYGRLGTAKPAYDRIGAAERTLRAVYRDHNAEHFADAFNLLMIEWVEGVGGAGLVMLAGQLPALCVAAVARGVCKGCWSEEKSETERVPERSGL